MEAFKKATGVRPLLVRVGGTLPIYPALAAKGIPTIGTGFALRESNVHSPNERLRVEDIDRAVAAAIGALSGPGRTWLIRVTRRRSRPRSRTTCSNGSSATSRSTRSRIEDSETYPSTAKQLDLGKLLADELRELGLEDVELTEHGYVFATLPGLGGPTVGLIAHMDTSSDESGTNVKPQVVREL